MYDVYVYFIQDLLKHTPSSHPDYPLLQDALRISQNFLSSINEESTPRRQSMTVKKGEVSAETPPSFHLTPLPHSHTSSILFTIESICQKRIFKGQRNVKISGCTVPVPWSHSANELPSGYTASHFHPSQSQPTLCSLHNLSLGDTAFSLFHTSIYSQSP